MDKQMFRVWTILCLATLAVLSWMPGQYMVRTSVLSGHEEHFLAYFLSAMTISVAKRHNTPPAWIGLALVLYAGVLELGQLYVPGRHSAVADFCASALGALMGAAVVFAVSRATARALQP